MALMTRRFGLGLLFAGALAAAGCVKETRPVPVLQATQATTEIPQAQLLDVGVHILDPGIPEEVEDDPDLQNEKRIWPDIRRAEARYVAMQLRDTLEGTGHWATARVVPATVNSFDVTVDGKIVESNGAYLKIEVTARDATGKVWIDEKEYEGRADTRVYRDNYTAGRDPFENVYVAIADDLLQRFGSEDALGVAAALGLLRELGPVVTALLFAGRAGTALTSEIGLMRATDQLTAMEVMAVDPMRVVAAPRFLGGVIAMPFLVAVFNVIGLLQRLQAEKRLTPDQKAELDRAIAGLEEYYFADRNGHTAPDLRVIAERWVTVVR